MDDSEIFDLNNLISNLDEKLNEKNLESFDLNVTNIINIKLLEKS